MLLVSAITPHDIPEGLAAGATIFLGVEELITESHQAGNDDRATASLVVGFAAMMTLDVALG